MTVKFQLYALGFVVATILSAVLAYGRHRELIGRRDAIIAATADTLKASRARSDSLTKLLKIEVPKTAAAITRWRTRYDSVLVEVPGPLRTRTDTVYRELLVQADSTIRQCEGTLSLCQQKSLEFQRQASLWESRYNSAMNAGVAAGACSAKTRAIYTIAGGLLGFGGGYASRR